MISYIAGLIVAIFLNAVLVSSSVITITDNNSTQVSPHTARYATFGLSVKNSTDTVSAEAVVSNPFHGCKAITNDVSLVNTLDDRHQSHFDCRVGGRTRLS
jgi:hypothetical protein